MAPPSLTYRRTIATIATSDIEGIMDALDTAFSAANSRWRVLARQNNGVSGKLEALEVAPPVSSPLANMRVLFAGSEDGALTPMMLEHSYQANMPMVCLAAPNGTTIAGAAPTLGTWSTASGSGGPYGGSSRQFGFVKIAGSAADYRELMVLTSDEDCAVWICTTTGTVWASPWVGASGYAVGTDAESERVFVVCTQGTTGIDDNFSSSFGLFTDWSSGNSAPKIFHLQPGGSTVRQSAKREVHRSNTTDATEHGNRMYVRFNHVWLNGGTPYKPAFNVRGPVLGRGEWRQLVDTAATDYWVCSSNLESAGAVDALLYPVMT